MVSGIIFDIKRYAIHDGPGIRTSVFFKGCPLNCLWCHNPEGIESRQEILFRSLRCQPDCSVCVSACPKKALKKKEGRLAIDYSRCDFCGKCEEACVFDAVSVVGRTVTVDQVIEQVEKDRIFFEESEGGITFSGGEPLLQAEFLEALCEAAHRRSLPVTVDTSGYVPFSDLERISPYVDLFLYDLKIMDDEKHRKFTGVSNKLILENLEKLAKTGKPAAVRIPLLAGINDDDKNIKKTADYLRSLKKIKHISLLPYHSGGKEKLKRLGKQNSTEAFSTPSKTRMAQIQEIFSDSGFLVKIGG